MIVIPKIQVIPDDPDGLHLLGLARHGQGKLLSEVSDKQYEAKGKQGCLSIFMVQNNPVIRVVLVQVHTRGSRCRRFNFRRGFEVYLVATWRYSSYFSIDVDYVDSLEYCSCQAPFFVLVIPLSRISPSFTPALFETAERLVRSAIHFSVSKTSEWSMRGNLGEVLRAEGDLEEAETVLRDVIQEQKEAGVDDQQVCQVTDTWKSSA